MNIEVASNKRFLDTTAKQAADDWDELLTSQVDLTIAAELAMLFEFDFWNRAHSVVDAGCGNGYYLSKIAEFFPDKRYLGIDISPALVTSAAAKHPDLDFRVADFFAAPQRNTDVLIMRYLVQHLGDFGAILRQARRALRPGGAMIIIESDLARSLMRPIPPEFYRMLITYHEVSASDGGLKGKLLTDLPGMVAETGEAWRVTGEKENATTLVGPFDNHDLLKVFRIWVDLAERSAMFSFDFDSVRRELASWAEEPASLVRLVTRMFVLEPEAG